ncbi:MAG TPA: AzlD domain-containing protein [Arenibaculum sp.]|nr:AzlD domain-containing protein [Arenibaculum sp.]
MSDLAATVAGKGWSWPLLLMVVGAAVTYLWRALGVALAGRIDPGGPVFEWVGCVAYALLAGLIARMIVLPVGPLQETDLVNRLLSAGLALAIFFLARRSIVLGVVTGVSTLVLLTAGGIRLP